MFAVRATTVLWVCVLISMRLPASAEAPPGRYVATASTIHDTRTQLVWQRQVPEAPLYTHSAAIAHCASLVLEGEGDWRLPSRPELLSIVDRSRWGPAIDPEAFPATPAWYYWTSTLSVHASDSVAFVDFFEGDSLFVDPSGEYHVRCVRGG